MPPSSPGQPAPRPELPRSYRTLPTQVIGWLLVPSTLVVGGLTAQAEGARGAGALVPLVVAACVLAVTWVVLLRPTARLEAGGVLLRNLVTDVWVPFERLAEVRHQWALELVDEEGTTHSAWAVPVRRHLRPPKERDLDSFADATRRTRSGRGTHAEAVAGDVETAWRQWRRESAPRADVAVEKRWSPAALAPLGVATVLVLFALLV
ncbi:hypothetical protein [Ornithinicoccus halotolerans]|uniref:hypothetical protein n=1 Tax=Ornithinicoccus halotolerans TaxID=1748220 RepID=UPI001296DE1F|nr:hypothetical protein [Ornithinicoccus halotolerans]